MRGHPRDFDSWSAELPKEAAEGSSPWDAAHVLPYFRRRVPFVPPVTLPDPFAEVLPGSRVPRSIILKSPLAFPGALGRLRRRFLFFLFHATLRKKSRGRRFFRSVGTRNLRPSFVQANVGRTFIGGSPTAAMNDAQKVLDAALARRTKIEELLVEARAAVEEDRRNNLGILGAPKKARRNKTAALRCRRST